MGKSAGLTAEAHRERDAGVVELQPFEAFLQVEVQPLLADRIGCLDLQHHTETLE